MAEVKELILRNLTHIPGGFTKFVLKRLNDRREDIFGKFLKDKVAFSWIKNDHFYIKCSNAALASELHYQKELILERIYNLLGPRVIKEKKWGLNISVGAVTKVLEESKKIEAKQKKSIFPTSEILEKFEDPRIRELMAKSKEI